MFRCSSHDYYEEVSCSPKPRSGVVTGLDVGDGVEDVVVAAVEHGGNGAWAVLDLNVQGAVAGLGVLCVAVGVSGGRGEGMGGRGGGWSSCFTVGALLEVWGLRIALVADRASRIIVGEVCYFIYHH